MGVRFTRLGVFLLLLALLLGARSAWALKVIPFGAEFEPRGSGATRSFRLENETPQPAAAQIRMVGREADLDGKEQASPADDDFVVFPAQLVLLGGETRTIRVQWVGNPAPATELSYRMIVELLPVDFEPAQRRGAQVKLMLRYEAAVYIVPSGAKRDPVVEAAEPVRGQNGQARLAVTVQNRGTAHALLTDVSLTVSSDRDGRSATLTGEQLRGLEGENVLAGRHRRFLLPWPAGLPIGPLRATIKLGNIADR